MRLAPIAALALLGSALAAAPAQAQPKVYRCGQTYQDAPCPQGKTVAVDDARSEAQRRAAEDVSRDEAKLGTALERERLAREQQTRAAPAATKRKASAPSAGASAPAKAKHRKKHAGADQREDFIAVEPAKPRPAKRATPQ